MGRTVQTSCIALHRHAAKNELSIVGKKFNSVYTTKQRAHLGNIGAEMYEGIGIDKAICDGFFCQGIAELKGIKKPTNTKRSTTTFSIEYKPDVLAATSPGSSDNDSDDAESELPAFTAATVADVIVAWVGEKVRSCTRLLELEDSR